MLLYNPTVSGSLLVTGSLTTTGTLTAQTLVVQTITSSVDFVTGSSVNGSLSSNTHQFTGSVFMSGSLDVAGTTSITGILTLGSTISNGTYAYTLPSATGTLALTSALSGTTGYHAKFTSSSAIGNSLIYDNGTNVGIGTTSPGSPLTFYVSAFNKTTLGDARVIRLENSDGTVQLNSRQEIGFGYSTAYQPVVIGHQITNNTDFTNGSFYVAVRSGTGNTAPVQALTVAAGGNVGIGTSSPRTSASGDNKTLDVKGGIYFGSTNAESCTINNDDSMIFNIDADNSSTSNFFRWATNTKLETGGTELMRLTEAGNLGIGTSSPGQKLEVIGTTKLSSAAGNVTGINIIPGSQTNIYQTIGDGASGGRFFASIETGYANYDNASSSYMYFKTQSYPATTSDVSVVQMTIRPTGDIRITTLTGSGTRTVVADGNGQLSAPVSDKSVKENIRPIGYGINDIMKMNPVWFEFKEEFKDYGTGRQNGNIAQELEAIIPEAVFLTPQTNRKGIEYGQLHAVYIKAIQELKAENDSLKEVLLRNNIV